MLLFFSWRCICTGPTEERLFSLGGGPINSNMRPEQNNNVVWCPAWRWKWDTLLYKQNSTNKCPSFVLDQIKCLRMSSWFNNWNTNKGSWVVAEQINLSRLIHRPIHTSFGRNKDLWEVYNSNGIHLINRDTHCTTNVWYNWIYNWKGLVIANRLKNIFSKVLYGTSHILMCKYPLNLLCWIITHTLPCVEIELGVSI